jgi:hypothetical protein
LKSRHRRASKKPIFIMRIADEIQTIIISKSILEFSMPTAQKTLKSIAVELYGTTCLLQHKYGI